MASPQARSLVRHPHPQRIEGIVYRVSLRRAGQTVWQLFREHDHGSAREALRAARQWRDLIARELEPETKQAFSQRLLPTNTSGQPGVYLKRQIVRRSGSEYEYLHWQAQSPAGAKPLRSRSFSVDRYGYDLPANSQCRPARNSWPPSKRTSASHRSLSDSGRGGEWL